MRRETDFVLEQAAWPALLLEINGRICRANQTALRVFGLPAALRAASFASLWDDKSNPPLEQFLSRPAPAASLKLRVAGGAMSLFAARGTQVAREGHPYVILQLFSKADEAGEPPDAPAKDEAPLPAPVSPAAPPSASPVPPQASLESSLAHKQKLDCALQLARSVALDFNNALTSILGHASLLLSKAEPDHPWRNSLNEIEKSAAKAAEIANDLAAFSRQDKDARSKSAGNLNTLLQRTVEAFQASLQKPVKIACQLERKLFTASFDEAKMQQAVVKILENAAEAIPSEGNVKVQSCNIELSEPMQDCAAKLTPGNYVCVEISDSGGGIAPDVLPRIFEPFFTTKGSQHRGLGLAWVYGIITNHGGAVAVSNRPDKGAAVRMYLPASRKIVRPAPAATGDLSGAQTILFVDDEDLLLTMGQMILSSYGYTVLTAASGQKALEIFTQSKKKIDLVITDLVMPNMSGRELTEQILRVSPGTLVLWSSGFSHSSSPDEHERYLQKPFTSQDLLRKVKQVLTAAS
jgi:signal transduction histidine kinase